MKQFDQGLYLPLRPNDFISIGYLKTGLGGGGGKRGFESLNPTQDVPLNIDNVSFCSATRLHGIGECLIKQQLFKANISLNY